MKKALLLFVMFTLPTQIFAGDNIWEGIDPIQLEATYKDKPITLSFITDESELTAEEWDKFKTTFIAFWKNQWKDMDHEKIGVKGDVDAFLSQQFDNAFDDLKTNDQACFLCFTVKDGDNTRPIFGIFSRKQLLTWEHENLTSQEMLFFRLLVQTEDEVMGSLVEFTKGLFKHLPEIIKERGCGKFLSLARATSAPQFNLENFGFSAINKADLPAEDNEWMVKHYPPEYYNYYLKDF